MATKLKGIRYTPELRSATERVLHLAKSSPPTSEGAKAPSAEAKAAGKSTIAQARAPLPFSEAKAILDQASSAPTDAALPMSAVKAMRSIIQSSSETADSKAAELAALEDALSKSSLQFEKPPPVVLDDEAKKHRKRMDRLRLRAEENKYKKLTSNLDTTVADDVTMQSMTYATSVGMNMIVAPISFGAFMFFFSGQLFGWIAGDSDERKASGQVDIRAVIAGVISGVAMLFIEMTLFVIRSHEMDASMRKKAKKNHANPFGFDKTKAKRTFEG